MERHKKMVMGPIDKVPCPWCGRENDFSDLDGMLEAGSPRDPSVADCDHCEQKMVIVKIDTRPRIIVKQHHR